MYGARPLKRTIQRAVLDPLALRVLQGDFGEGTTSASMLRTASWCSRGPTGRGGLTPPVPPA